VLRRRLAIRTKLVLLSVTILAGVSFVSAALDYTLSRQWIEEDLQDRAIVFAREIALTIRGTEDLAEPDRLGPLLERLTEIRPDARQLDILVFAGETTRVAASSAPATRLPFTRRDVARVQRGGVVSRLVETDAGRSWEILVPVTLQGAVVGGVAAKFSAQRVERLISRIAVWNFSITAASVGLMAALVWLSVRAIVDRPLSRFVGAIERIRSGDAAATVDIHSGDEFADLAGHFNDMMARLRRFSDELQVRVAEATSELDRRYEELRRVNAALFEVQRRLARAERLALSGRLMAEVAHEVGTPLHSVAGHLELLRKEAPAGLRSPEFVRRLDIVDRQVARVIQIISRLLDLTRMPLAQPQRVDVGRLVRETADLIAPAVDRARVTLMVEAPALPATVRGHADQLQQALLNLLANAIDATPPGGVIGTAVRARSGEVEIEVRDSGPGIPHEDRAHIFEPFFSRKPSRPGTGLGLSITAQIVREHRGRIEVGGEPGRGAILRVLIPAGRAE
jgi:signal transduction histidine kinase